ncbi:ATP-binding cassette domain-containing protein [Actinocrispum wychmicini]|uniref:Peptide/nickel transport system ATP-binding protein n=1 Tax=Actinocrispum wychmicini TaxID=1213861 RepID=A0A4R2J6R6_9PSEU|nr:ABC transporter ATP-binding protein [Actinocrispum wychmicini]TCO54174.1 peptide/nickel transport system ATP-binding protein [Actinocrispum wychmicini]
MADPLVSVRDLVVSDVDSGARIVDGIGFDVARGETVAIVGESGSGKSMTARALMGLLPQGVRASGTAMFGPDNLITAPERRMRRIRGSGIGMLLQDPFTLLNPLIRTGTHIGETLRSAGRFSRADLRREVARRLDEVGVRQATARYPVELSGGMRQRVGLAAAIAKNPDLLIADEPTTALDSTTQREVLRLLRDIQRDRGMSLLLITHDLNVAFSLCDRVLVMHSGVILEEATPDQLRAHPATEYTARLLAADLPLDRRLDRIQPATTTPIAARVVNPSPGRPLLRVRDLVKRFDGHQALKGVDVEVIAGCSVGVVGESGSGKTTLARCVLGLETPTSGSIELDGTPLSPADLGRVRGMVQCVFQDPYSSLNPAHSIGFTLGEVIRRRGTPGEADEVAGLLASVGLPADYARRRPVALSGGQRQRVAIARALAMRPKILVCDEPVAALDVSVQAQVLQLLRDLQDQGLTLLFITHDLSVVRQMTDELVVLYRGEVVESGPTEKVLGDPRHDYTQRLLAAVPSGTADWLNPSPSPTNPC